MVFATALQTRGGNFSSFSGLRSGDVAGATGKGLAAPTRPVGFADKWIVWSMPGGFTSSGRDGYQTVDEPVDVQTPKPLGTTQPPPPPTTQQGAPNAYQNV